MGALGDAITRKFVGTSEQGSFSSGMRRRRFDLLLELFPDLGEMRVLDIGGAIHFWPLAPVQPQHVTLLNMFSQDPEESWMTAVVGDGCNPPDDLPEVDLVISNSVIEHVGGHWRRQALAEHIRGAAPRYWVQTPYRFFPIEPHYLCPGVQFAPVPLQAKIVRRWPFGHGKTSDPQRALESVMDIELLTVTQMRAYFPDAALHRERLAGITKSLISVRQ